MSRERPVEPIRTIPDAQRGMRFERGNGLKKNELEHLKSFSGAAFMGWWFSKPFDGGKKRFEPKFIRRGYEASIVDNLNDFYAARPRPWRPRGCDSCKPTFKERLKMQRRARDGHAR